MPPPEQEQEQEQEQEPEPEPGPGSSGPRGPRWRGYQAPPGGVRLFTGRGPQSRGEPRGARGDERDRDRCPGKGGRFARAVCTRCGSLASPCGSARTSGRCGVRGHTARPRGGRAAGPARTAPGDDDGPRGRGARRGRHGISGGGEPDAAPGPGVDGSGSRERRSTEKSFVRGGEGRPVRGNEHHHERLAPAPRGGSSARHSASPEAAGPRWRDGRGAEGGEGTGRHGACGHVAGGRGAGGCGAGCRVACLRAVGGRGACGRASAGRVAGGRASHGRVARRHPAGRRDAGCLRRSAWGRGGGHRWAEGGAGPRWGVSAGKEVRWAP